MQTLELLRTGSTLIKSSQVLSCLLGTGSVINFIVNPINSNRPVLTDRGRDPEDTTPPLSPFPHFFFFLFFESVSSTPSHSLSLSLSLSIKKNNLACRVLYPLAFLPFSLYLAFTDYTPLDSRKV